MPETEEREITPIDWRSMMIPDSQPTEPAEPEPIEDDEIYHKEVMEKAAETMAILEELRQQKQEAEMAKANLFKQKVKAEDSDDSDETEPDDGSPIGFKPKQMLPSSCIHVLDRNNEEPIKPKKKRYYNKLNVAFKPEFIQQIDEYCKSNDLVKRQFVKDALKDAMNPKTSIWSKLFGRK